MARRTKTRNDLIPHTGYAMKPLQDWPAEQRNQIANEIPARYMAGEQIADMAPGYGVSGVSLYALLLREYEATWKDVQAARALARMERALAALERCAGLA
jgi:hypothetical protein